MTPTDDMSIPDIRPFIGDPKPPKKRVGKFETEPDDNYKRQQDHDNQIREDERRKIGEWLTDHRATTLHAGLATYCFCVKDIESLKAGKFPKE